MDNKITLRANAKINLFLEVLDKRKDGYHNIETIFQSIKLHDIISFSKSETDEISIKSNNPKIPLDSSNIVYKSAELLIKENGKGYGVDIYIDKKIPIGAGLAGGSTDAGATLIGLNKLWKLGYTFDKLLEFGARLGSDVPFCMVGGTALGKGRGELLTKLNPFPKLYIVIANPDFQVSTAWAYKNLSNLSLTRERKNGNIIIEKIQNGDLAQIGCHLFNVFESLVMKEYPILREIKLKMLELGVLGAMMTGSGSTVFAIANTMQIAEKVQEKISKIVDNCIITETSVTSITEI